MKLKDIIEDIKILDQYKSRQDITIECNHCNKPMLQKKNTIQGRIARGQSAMFCDVSCQSASRAVAEMFTCAQCNKSFCRNPSDNKKSKNFFCGSSCSATYNNRNKKYGIRRSKLEQKLEELFDKNKFKFKVLFNDKSIGSELDIFIPKLNLAFELNGIVHYKPIYGEEKLQKIKKNDRLKRRQCVKKNIKLHIINVSKIKHLTEERSLQVYEKIVKMIDSQVSYMVQQ